MFGNINADSVTTTHLAPDAVTSAEIADDAIGNEHLQDNAVATDNITDSAVTNSKLATPTFSVNGIQAQLGNNVVVSTQNDPMYLNHSVMASMSASIGTTATTFTEGFCSLRRLPTPISVPPVPNPATKTSISGKSFRISWPVVS